MTHHTGSDMIGEILSMRHPPGSDLNGKIGRRSHMGQGFLYIQRNCPDANNKDQQDNQDDLNNLSHRSANLLDSSLRKWPKIAKPLERGSALFYYLIILKLLLFEQVTKETIRLLVGTCR